MNEETKSGYIAGGIFLLIGILVSVVGFESGWNSGKITIILGLFMTLVGAGSIWKPNTIGQPVAHYLERFADTQKTGTSGGHKQTQTRSKNSPQGYTEKGDVHLTQNFYEKRP